MAEAGGNWFLGWPVADAALDAMLEAMLPGVRVIPRPDRHLTAVFLGACGARRARQAWAAQQELALGALTVYTAAPALAGGRGRVLVLTLGEGGDDCARDMQRLAERCLPAAGLPLPSRAPWPHITVARLRKPLAGPRLAQWRSRSRPLCLRLQRLALYGRAAHGAGHRYARHGTRMLS